MTNTESTWQTITTTPATHCEPHLTSIGVAHPCTEVSLTGDHVVLCTLGPEGDVPEARLTAAEARAVAAGLLRAADALEAAL